MKHLIDNLNQLGKAELTKLLSNYSEEDFLYAREKSRSLTDKLFGRKVIVRGLIEFSNYCKNNCYYCGIRAGNDKLERYRLQKEIILECCRKGFDAGIRTFVLQSGEDLYYTDEILCDIVSSIKKDFPQCALTLSVGEKERAVYKAYKEAGADRFLLRHETAEKAHYEKLHPQIMSFDHRMKCLRDLKELGFQTGCGIMVGSPFQTHESIAQDLIFMRQFQPQMVGIGPFLPQHDTPFAACPAGSVPLTLFLLCIIRLLLPNALLPSTTALNTAKKNGRIDGIDCGANVIMPNLTPVIYRDKYLLYDNKQSVKMDDVINLDDIKKELEDSGYEMSLERGDYRKII